MSPETVRCWTCNKETRTGLPACPHCGASPYFSGDEQETNAPRLTVTEDEYSVQGDWVTISKHIARHHPLFGAKGWVRVFAILTIIGNVGAIVLIVKEVIPFWQSDFSPILAAFAALEICLSMYGLFVANKLLRVHTNAWRHVFVFLALSPAIAVLGAIVLGALYPDLIDLAHREMASEAGRRFILAAIWALYFLKSKRVIVTFYHRVRLNDPFLKRVGRDAEASRNATQSTVPR